MATTYELLGTATADGSSPTTLSIGSIPQTHDDLEIIGLLTAINSGYQAECKWRINGETGSYYNYSWLRQVNNSVQTDKNTSGDTGIGIYNGLGPNHGSYMRLQACTKLYIAGYTESSGGSPAYGFTSGIATNRSITDSSTNEMGIYSFSCRDASLDPVTEVSVSTAAMAENSVIYIYGINRS